MNVKFQCTKINHKNGINNSINYSVKSSILIPCKKIFQQFNVLINMQNVYKQ